MKGLNKILINNLPFVVVLILAIIIRLNVFDYPLTQEETNRDFLIARHIVKYEEFPLIGPMNGTLPMFGNSPSYYYLLAFLIFLFDNFMFVSSVNLIMQISTIILLYIVVKKIFGTSTALIMALFLSFSKIFLVAAVWPWQPYLMFFFIVCSLFLLFDFYQRKKPPLLIASIVLFSFSCSLHMSAFGLLPAFFVTTFYILRSQKAKPKTYFSAVFAFVLTITLLFLPLLMHSGGEGILVSPSFEISITRGVSVLLKSFLLKPNILSIFLLGLLLAYLKFQKNKQKREAYAIFLGWFASFLIITSFAGEGLLDQHLYPIYPIFIILLSESILKFFPQKPLFTLSKYILIAYLAIIFSTGSVERVSTFPFKKLTAANEISKILSQEVLKIASEEGYPNLNFFQFSIYASPANYWWEGNGDIIDSIYWVLVETGLDYKFVELNQENLQGTYRPTGSNNYLILACIYYEELSEEDSDCIPRFLDDHPNYSVLRKVPGHPYQHSFYVTKIKQKI